MVTMVFWGVLGYFWVFLGKSTDPSLDASQSVANANSDLKLPVEASPIKRANELWRKFDSDLSN